MLQRYALLSVGGALQLGLTPINRRASDLARAALPIISDDAQADFAFRSSVGLSKYSEALMPWPAAPHQAVSSTADA